MPLPARLLLMFSIFALGLPSLSQERRPPEDAVIKLTINLQAGGTVTGQVTSYDEFAFTITAEDGRTHRIQWTRIPAPAVDQYWRFMERPEGDGDKLFELGQLLLVHRDGRELAQAAFEEAVEADPGLAQRAEQALAGQDAGDSFRRIGEGDPAYWGELTRQVMNDGTLELRGFCEKTVQQMRLPLRLYESERFIICTDMDQAWVAGLSPHLTEAYRQTTQLLGEDPDGNIFRGKCLIFIFDKRVDYFRFQRDMHDTDARGTGALCHGFGDGFVHIATFRRPTHAQTHHIVAHEVVHGIVHRYRAPVPIPDWVNEGLAVYLAHQVVPPSSGRSLYTKAALLVDEQGLGEGFFEGENLPRSQYPVAGGLTQFMLERGRTAYVRFIDAIKDGEPWPEALEDAYRMDQRRLTLRYKTRLTRELGDRLGG